MDNQKIPHSIKSVILLTRLLDEAVEKRGELILQSFKEHSDPELDSLRERERNILQELNKECDRLEKMIDLERALEAEDKTI